MFKKVTWYIVHTYFPRSPMAKTALPIQGAQVRSLVRDLDPAGLN